MRLAAKVTPVNIDNCSPFKPAAVEKHEEALLQYERQTSNKVRALDVCHPHNPLSRGYPEQTIIEIMKVCQKYQIHLISDEVYALSTWENQIDPTPVLVKYQSLLSINRMGIIDPGLTHILWGKCLLSRPIVSSRPVVTLNDRRDLFNNHRANVMRNRGVGFGQHFSQISSFGNKPYAYFNIALG